MLHSIAIFPVETGAWATVQGLPPIDIVGLTVIGLLVLLGLWRGLWWQVIRLVGLLASVALARIFSPEAAQWMQESWGDLSPRVAHGIAWGSVFLLTLGAASILGMLGQKILETIKLGLVNRLLGGLIGALTGGLIHIAILVCLSQLAPEDFVKKHLGGSYSEEALVQTSSRWRIVLGEEAANEIDLLLENAAAASALREAGMRASESSAEASGDASED